LILKRAFTIWDARIRKCALCAVFRGILTFRAFFMAFLYNY